MAGATSFEIVTESDEREIKGKLEEWDARLGRMRLSALQLEGEALERYREILRDLTTRVEALRSRWQRIRGRLYVAGEDRQRVMETLESLEKAYEEVREEIESLSARPDAFGNPSAAGGG